MQIAFLLVLLMSTPLGQTFYETAGFAFNLAVSVAWILVLIYVAWKVLDNQKKLDEKQTKTLEQLEKILEHLSAKGERRDADS